MLYQFICTINFSSEFRYRYLLFSTFFTLYFEPWILIPQNASWPCSILSYIGFLAFSSWMMVKFVGSIIESQAYHCTALEMQAFSVWWPMKINSCVYIKASQHLPLPFYFFSSLSKFFSNFISNRRERWEKCSSHLAQFQQFSKVKL